MDLEGGWMWRKLLISQYDHISAFFHCTYISGTEGAGCGGMVDVEGGWMWRNHQSGCARYHSMIISQPFFMHQYFLKM